MALRAHAVVLALSTVTATSLVVGLTTRAPSHAVPFDGVAHSAHDADVRAQAMLDRVYLLGAVRVAPPVGYRANHPHQYEVQDERWLSTTGTPSNVRSALLAHPPTGFAVSTAKDVTTSPDAVTTELRPVGQGTSLMHLLEVTATRAGEGRALVLLQAVVAWVPPRSAAETIGPDVVTGELTSGFGDSPDATRLRQRRLSPAEVRALAAALNARPTVSPYSGNACPAGNLGLAILTVPDGTGQAVYQIDIGACGQVQVQVNGQTQPNLAGGTALSNQIADLLGDTSAGT